MVATGCLMMQVVSNVIRSFVVRHHRSAFFLALFLAYLVVLFGVAGVRDPGHPGRTLARLATSAIELGLFGLLCAACMRMARTGRRWLWLPLSGVIAAIAAVVYMAQVYSLYLSGNFISVLAMQNTDSVAFIGSPRLVAGAAMTLAWIAAFCMALVIAVRAPAQSRRAASESWRTRSFVAAGAGMALVFTYLLLLQSKGVRLEPGFRQAPISNLVANVYRAEIEPESFEPVAMNAPSNVHCFDYGADPRTSVYPFQRASAFRGPLPFERRGTVEGKPNVIVIFTEGVSARLIGAYGGPHPDLTPNIDALSGQSMRVVDYFNHTAATYRGLSGELSSGFSFAGGDGHDGWEAAGNRAGLSSIRRQTLPFIFGAAGYQSYFFAPHREDRPIILMLHSLGFQKVFAYESVAGELLDGKVTTRAGTSGLDDDSLFRGLTAFLQKRSTAGAQEPFLVGIYNIGTHAFLGSAEHDVPYPGDNAVLDKLHNFDSALGGFLRYFYRSPYADNTILVFTTDHSTYPEAPFREVAGADLRPYFVDRIPLLVRDPHHRLPPTFDAKGRNSLDLAPTVLQLAGLQTQANSFMGTSLFEPRNFPLGIAALGGKFYLTTPAGVFAEPEVPAELRETFTCEADVVRRFYSAERDNRIFRASVPREVGAYPESVRTMQ